MRYFLLTIIAVTIHFAQELKFAVVNNFDPSGTRSAEIIKTIETRSGLDDLEFILFNGIKPGGIDENYFANIRTEKYFLPHHDEFDWLKVSRNKFIQKFGGLNFHFESDSISIIGLNCSVFWNDKSSISREELNYVEDELKELPEQTEVAFILPVDPSVVTNIDDLLNLFAGRKVRFIYSGSGNDKAVTIFEGFEILHETGMKKEESLYQVIELKNDTTKLFQVISDSTEIMVKSTVSKSGIYQPPNRVGTHDPDSLIVWQKDLNASLIGDVILSDGKIIGADRSGRVICLDTSGEKLWEYFSFGNIYSSPVMKDGFAAAATIQGDLETIDLETGEAIQSIGFDNSITSDLLVVDYDGPKKLMIPKQSSSKAAVIVGTASGSVYCYDLETLQEYWVFETPQGAIQGKPLLKNNQIIFYSAYGIIYCIDAANGWLIWKVKSGKPFPVASDPVANAENIYISVPEDKLYSIEALLGKVNWSHSKYDLWTSLGIADAGNILFAKSADNRFHYLSARLGTWVRELYPELGIERTTTDIIEVGNSVYFGLEDGYLVKIYDRDRIEKILQLDNSSLFDIKPFDKEHLLIASRNGSIALIRIN